VILNTHGLASKNGATCPAKEGEDNLRSAMRKSLNLHAWRVFTILYPFQGVCLDIGSNTLPFRFIPDDVFVIIALKERLSG
jgi:hypothetical protein